LEPCDPPCVTTTLDAWDIAALRFGIGGLLLAPILLRHGPALDGLGFPGLQMLIAGDGPLPKPNGT